MDVRTRLHEFAVSRCLPYLMRSPQIGPYIQNLSFILVGSVATGFCGEKSDIDIAIVCDNGTLGLISHGVEWSRGKPTEVMLEGVQLHYYAVSFDEIERRIASLDDLSLYVYLNAVPLLDPQDQFARMINRLDRSEIQHRRLKFCLDHLSKRSRVLDEDLSTLDPLVMAGLFIELIHLAVKTVALIDDVPFDPRKRVLTTGLMGALGQRVRPDILQLLSDIGELGHTTGSPSFPYHFRNVLGTILSTANRRK